MSIFTLADISGHNTKGSSWIAIHNKVYDVTHFLQQHPGGEEVLLDVLGTNATESFEDVGHSEESRELLSRYLLGSLHEDDCEAWVEKKSVEKCEQNGKVNDNDASSLNLIFIVLLVGVCVISLCKCWNLLQ